MENAFHSTKAKFLSRTRMMFTIEGDDIVGRRLHDGYILLRLKSLNKNRWPHDISIAALSEHHLDIYVAELFSGKIQRYSLLT